MLTVYNKKDGQPFNTDNQRLLAIIAGQSAQVVENARLIEEEKLYIKMQQEIGLAAKIQRTSFRAAIRAFMDTTFLRARSPLNLSAAIILILFRKVTVELRCAWATYPEKGFRPLCSWQIFRQHFGAKPLFLKFPRKPFRSNPLFFESMGPEKFANLFEASSTFNSTISITRMRATTGRF